MGLLLIFLSGVWSKVEEEEEIEGWEWGGVEGEREERVEVEGKEVARLANEMDEAGTPLRRRWMISD